MPCAARTLASVMAYRTALLPAALKCNELQEIKGGYFIYKNLKNVYYNIIVTKFDSHEQKTS